MEFLVTVERELEAVEKWLDSFVPTGFLEDRLGALGEALEQERGTDG